MEEKIFKSLKEIHCLPFSARFWKKSPLKKDVYKNKGSVKFQTNSFHNDNFYKSITRKV